MMKIVHSPFRLHKGVATVTLSQGIPCLRGLMLILTLAAGLSACNSLPGLGPPKPHLQLKYPGTEKQELDLKSGGSYTATKTYTGAGRSAKSASHFICVANYDIDMTRGAATIGAPVTQSGQTKVCFAISGAEGTDEKEGLKEGSYPARKSGQNIFQFNVTEPASIRIFENGQEKRFFLDDSKTSGEVRITAATADSINGEINLSDGTTEIKGPFTAKPFKR